jgi:hypothetical protein
MSELTQLICKRLLMELRNQFDNSIPLSIVYTDSNNNKMEESPEAGESI